MGDKLAFFGPRKEGERVVEFRLKARWDSYWLRDIGQLLHHFKHQFPPL